MVIYTTLEVTSLETAKYLLSQLKCITQCSIIPWEPDMTISTLTVIFFKRGQYGEAMKCQ